MNQSDETRIARIEALLDEGQEHFTSGAVEEAVTVARTAIHRCRDLGEQTPLDLLVESWLLLADSYTELREDENALDAYQQVLQVDADATEAVFGIGRLHFLRWEFEPATQLFERCRAAGPEVAGPALYHMAILAQFDDREDEARKMFAEAERLDPETCPRPVTSEESEVLSLLDEIVDDLPAEIRGALDNVVFDVVDLPDRSQTGTENPPTVLGLYTGAPVSEAHSSIQYLPNAIRIYRKNIERIANDREHLLEELRVTILHEIGHHLGWDDDDLGARGLA